MAQMGYFSHYVFHKILKNKVNKIIKLDVGMKVEI